MLEGRGCLKKRRKLLAPIWQKEVVGRLKLASGGMNESSAQA